MTLWPWLQHSPAEEDNKYQSRSAAMALSHPYHHSCSRSKRAVRHSQIHQNSPLCHLPIAKCWWRPITISQPGSSQDHSTKCQSTATHTSETCSSQRQARFGQTSNPSAVVPSNGTCAGIPTHRCSKHSTASFLKFSQCSVIFAFQPGAGPWLTSPRNTLQQSNI
jgi:hypothetical protein